MGEFLDLIRTGEERDSRRALGIERYCELYLRRLAWSKKE